MPLEPVRTEGHPSALEVEEHWLAGRLGDDPELPDSGRSTADLAEIATHVAGCAHCQEQIRALEQAQRDFLLQHPSDELLGPAFDALTDAPPQRRRGPRRALLAVAATLLIGLGVLLGRGLPLGADAPGLRARGGAELGILVEDGGRWLPALDRELVEGDRVRWSVRLEEPGHPLLVLLQDDGEAFLAWPHRDRLAEQKPIPSGGPVVLRGVAELDGYGGREELWLWVAADPWTQLQIDRVLARPGRMQDEAAGHIVQREGAR
jgi:hypothetical protein